MTADLPSSTDRAARLDQAFEEFMLLADTPDAATLERMIGRYPDLAAELTTLAEEWLLQDMLPSLSADPEEWRDDAWQNESAPSAVDQAMASLHRELSERDLFANRSSTELLGIATRLGLDKTLLAKLRDRRLVATTVPESLIAALADAFDVAIQTVREHLLAPPRVPLGVRFKADQKPQLSDQRETFDDAVERSTLDADQRQQLASRWLAPSSAAKELDAS